MTISTISINTLKQLHKGALVYAVMSEYDDHIVDGLIEENEIATINSWQTWDDCIVIYPEWDEDLNDEVADQFCSLFRDNDIFAEFALLTK